MTQAAIMASLFMCSLCADFRGPRYPKYVSCATTTDRAVFPGPKRSPALRRSIKARTSCWAVPVAQVLSTTKALTKSTSWPRAILAGPFGENYGPAIYNAGIAGDLFINSGTLIKLANADDYSGVSEIYVDVDSTGTISVPNSNSNLRFDGANNSFSGTFIGGGMIDYGDPLTPGYGTETLGNINMTSGACTTSWATVNQNGELTLSYSSTINSNGVWNFTSDNGMLLDGLSDDAEGYAQFDASAVTKTGGTGTTVIGVPVYFSTNTAIVVMTGTLQFDGGEALISGELHSELNQAGPNVFAGSISGAGIFSLGGGGTDDIDSGVTITTSGWTITDAGTEVTLNESLSYSGTFTDQSGANSDARERCDADAGKS